MAGQARYRSIQLARAIAALAVICVHLSGVTNNLAPVASPGRYTFGQAGVDLFFVISGFIISMVIARRQSWNGFIMRRALRIYPFYWAFTIAWVVLAYLGGKDALEAGYLVRSLLGWPMEAAPALGVGWSLEHEFVFYALVAVLIAVRQEARLPAVMAILFAVSVAANLIVPRAVADGQDMHLLSLYHGEFLFGVLLYRVRDRVANMPWVPLVVAGAVLFPASAAVLHALYGSHIPTQPHGMVGLLRVMLFGTAGFLLLSGLFAAERQKPAWMATPVVRGLDAIGNASYGLYLSHPILFGIGGVLVGRIWPATAPVWPAAVLALGVAILFSLAWFRWIEHPFTRRIGERRGPLPNVDGPA